MAITKHDATQPYLNNLEPTNSTPDHGDYSFPSIDEIDVENVEFILDVDLDELDIFFEDKSNPYTVEAMTDDYSLLVDMFEDRVVGVVINQFYSRQLVRYPAFISTLRYATVIAGESVQTPPTFATTDRSTAVNDTDHCFESSKREVVATVSRMIGIE